MKKKKLVKPQEGKKQSKSLKLSEMILLYVQVVYNTRLGHSIMTWSCEHFKIQNKKETDVKILRQTKKNTNKYITIGTYIHTCYNFTIYFEYILKNSPSNNIQCAFNFHIGFKQFRNLGIELLFLILFTQYSNFVPLDEVWYRFLEKPFIVFLSPI